jgi:hypothetical protein
MLLSDAESSAAGLLAWKLPLLLLPRAKLAKCLERLSVLRGAAGVPAKPRYTGSSSVIGTITCCMLLPCFLFFFRPMTNGARKIRRVRAKIAQIEKPMLGNATATVPFMARPCMLWVSSIYGSALRAAVFQASLSLR